MDWESQFEHEIQQAERARQAGNEGMARVCARRAAGCVIGEFLLRKGLNLPGSSAYSRLHYLRSMPDVSPSVRDAAHVLLLRITPEHELPVETDLIERARWLRETLLES